ncbi:carbohydrate-binding protein [Paenibacillus sp. TAF58]
MNIPTAGTYLVDYRIATPNKNAKISLDINSGGTVLGEITLPNTGSFSTYRTVSHQIQIPGHEITNHRIRTYHLN